jgi:hypothetical protein
MQSGKEWYGTVSHSHRMHALQASDHIEQDHVDTF